MHALATPRVSEKRVARLDSRALERVGPFNHSLGKEVGVGRKSSQLKDGFSWE